MSDCICDDGYACLAPDCPCPRDASLEAKLSNFDQHATDAVFDLIQLLFDQRERLIALARERHIWGHHTYGDGNFREWDDARLLVERDQEVADWLVYRTEELRRHAA
jgi:hypothetical protein